jgi:hypothetical protein
MKPEERKRDREFGGVTRTLHFRRRQIFLH